jgi:opine dehydrogenase
VRIGIAGCGGIGLASAAHLAAAGHEVTVWSPRGADLSALRRGPLLAQGVLQAEVRVAVADDALALCQAADVLLVAVPAQGHRAVIDALLPGLQGAQRVIVSSMASLSALYLAEAARLRGLAVPVVSLASTVLTARREAPDRVRVLTRRGSLGLSALPQAAAPELLALCQGLFGDVFTLQPDALTTTLSNANPVSHGPLALFNWTRIERAEAWPQYQHLTPHVAAVIEQLDQERQALARAFGLQLKPLAQHFAHSFGTRSERLADIAAELHAARGGPPGPTDVQTRFLHEDMPYGLVFSLALARLAGVPMPATGTVVDAASLICGADFRAGNDLLEPLRLAGSTVAGLLQRLA